MKKAIMIAALLILLLIPIATAQLSQCDDTPSVLQNCTFVTPPLLCADFHFNITDMNGDMIENGSLVVHNAELNLYEFNFTLVTSVADYQVTLCDNTFREVFVGGDDMSVPTIVTGQMIFLIIMIILTFIFLFISLHVEDPVFGFVSGSLFIFIGWLFFDNPFNFSASAGAAVFGKATFIGLTAFGVMMMLLGIYILFSSVQMFFNRKKGQGIQPNQRLEGHNEGSHE